MDRQTKLDVLQKEIWKSYYWEHYVALDSILSDVLVWFQWKVDITVDWRWLIHIKSYKLELDMYISRDLTKPYLSEQSDEVISGLYEVFLLTKKD